jgi:hypothetical protein
MKFLLSEGRIICLLEKDDAGEVTRRNLPQIDLLLMPLSIRNHIENSHTWSQVIQKVKNGLKNVVYF